MTENKDILKGVFVSFLANKKLEKFLSMKKLEDQVRNKIMQ